jgi:hypothetical protein
MRGRLLYGALAIAIMVSVAACDETLSDLTGPTPNLEPTFTSIQNEIFSSGDSSGRVPCTQCHNVIGGRFNGLDLSPAVSYGNLVGVGSRGKVGAVRVIAGDPENSYLVHKLEGRSGIVGVRMPLNGPPYLTAGQILVIRRWIELGARND